MLNAKNVSLTRSDIGEMKITKGICASVTHRAGRISHNNLREEQAASRKIQDSPADGDRGSGGKDIRRPESAVMSKLNAAKRAARRRLSDCSVTGTIAARARAAACGNNGLVKRKRAARCNLRVCRQARKKNRCNCK